MVPKPLQEEVWKHYRRGQEVDKDPSREYLVAARNAINAVAEKEGQLLLPMVRGAGRPLKDVASTDQLSFPLGPDGNYMETMCNDANCGM